VINRNEEGEVDYLQGKEAVHGAKGWGVKENTLQGRTILVGVGKRHGLGGGGGQKEPKRVKKPGVCGKKSTTPKKNNLICTTKKD